MRKFGLIVLVVISFQINCVYVEAVEDKDLNSFENQIPRAKRQTDELQTCITPNIINGKIKILSQKYSTATPASSYLLLNITCNHNYVLYPPSNNIILCVNGLWDKETPQCIQCGQRADNIHKPFVVNGSLSKFGDFPWHVGIYKKDPSDSHPLYRCGGSIINENSILTVAHCFTDESGKTKSSREYYSAAGKYYSNYDSDKDKYAQKRKVARVDVHPQYKGYFTNYAWDIAVIVVDKPFEISNLVQPICVDWMTDFENEQLIPNQYGEIAGWGATETNLQSTTLELRVLKVPFIRAQQCTNLVPSEFIRYITPDKFCAGYTNGSSVCGGDSGGGLVFEREENRQKRFYIRGLVSVGVQLDGTCDYNKYSTYTKVSDYIPFIQDSLSNKVITIKPSTDSTNPTASTISIPCTTPNKEQAKCLSIYKCKIFVDALQNSPTTEVLNFIRDSKCGQENDKTVCCGSTINYLSIINSNPVTTKPIVHRNLNLLPSPGVCGRQTSVRKARIVGGNVTTLLDYPWMVLLQYGISNNSRYKCAGFLINERYVLTAAHCVSGIQNRIDNIPFQIRLGEYNLNTEIDCVNVSEGTGILPDGKDCADPPLDIAIEKIITHPSFKTTIADIALIKLAKNVVFTDFIKPICLPLNGEKSLPGKQIVMSGWGHTENGISSLVKRKVFISIVGNEECSKFYNRSVQIESTHVCAGGTDGKDSCSGDTGGPMMSTLTNSRDVYAEGIISFGPRLCGFKGLPGVGTRVSEFIPWILDNIST